jgi:hypothetical protein
VFNESNYSVHPRMTLIESWLTRKCTDFEIRTIPHRSRHWFSFSWRTGVLRQEPAGAELLAIKPPRPPGLFVGRTYEVIDSRTGQTMAKFIPRGSDWEIEHPSGEIAARILRDTSGVAFVRYRALIGDAEVCQFKWALAGLSVTSAQLEIVFPDQTPAGPLLDRALALAIAPVLEQQARMTSERHSP